MQNFEIKFLRINGKLQNAESISISLSFYVQPLLKFLHWARIFENEDIYVYFFIHDSQTTLLLSNIWILLARWRTICFRALPLKLYGNDFYLLSQYKTVRYCIIKYRVNPWKSLNLSQKRSFRAWLNAIPGKVDEFIPGNMWCSHSKCKRIWGVYFWVFFVVVWLSYTLVFTSLRMVRGFTTQKIDKFILNGVRIHLNLTHFFRRMTMQDSIMYILLRKCHVLLI